MRVLNQSYLAQAWADIDRSNRIREARQAAGGTVCRHCLKGIAKAFGFYHHVAATDKDSFGKYHIECADGLNEAQV